MQDVKARSLEFLELSVLCPSVFGSLSQTCLQAAEMRRQLDEALADKERQVVAAATAHAAACSFTGTLQNNI